MSEFFKQLITQFSAVWQRLSLQQRVVTASILGLTVLGLITLLVWSGSNVESSGGMKKLYSSLDMEDASVITEKLTQMGFKYKLEDNGTSIMVDSKKVYEARMALAREGLPSNKGFGYELFDKTNMGVTDFVQKLNARRALEGELKRTIEGLHEVQTARIHLVIPENTIYLDQQKDPKASVVIKTFPGKNLSKEQVNGIAHLVSSSVDGLKINNVSIVDFNGKLLSNPYGNDESAVISSRNLDLQQTVEAKLEAKVDKILTSVLGPNKATVQIAVDLDFDQVQKTIEKFNPEGRVVRSEERSEESVKNAPDGDRTQERSLANYEIDKTVEQIIMEVGNVKRVTVSVAVDGRYSRTEDGKEEYAPRSTEEVANIEEIVKNAVGYDLARGDRIVVASMQFDNDFARKEQEIIEKELKNQQYTTWIKMGLGVFVFILLLLLVRSITRTVAEAMNPPLPDIQFSTIEEEVPVEVPEDIRRSNELLERVELMTQQSPMNIASVIKDWLMEPSQPKASKKKGGKG